MKKIKNRRNYKNGEKLRNKQRIKEAIKCKKKFNAIGKIRKKR